jgi:hypothetical protein
MSGDKVTSRDMREAVTGGKTLVYNKTTGQFEVLGSTARVDPTKQTQMTPSNIPNANLGTKSTDRVGRRC